MFLVDIFRKTTFRSLILTVSIRTIPSNEEKWHDLCLIATTVLFHQCFYFIPMTNSHSNNIQFWKKNVHRVLFCFFLKKEERNIWNKFQGRIWVPREKKATWFKLYEVYYDTQTTHARFTREGDASLSWGRNSVVPHTSRETKEWRKQIQ